MSDVASKDAPEESAEWDSHPDALPIDVQPAPAAAAPGRSAVGHAKQIGTITFFSRIVGLLADVIALRGFGASGVYGAWVVAFAVPNLFRKLLGEGALSAAFVPLYAKSLKRDADANAFANASVNLLAGLLLSVTIIGEAVLIGLQCAFHFSADDVLVLRFSTVMLPYVTLVCLTAFLGGILQVHERFLAFAATPIVLNLLLIILIVVLARKMDLHDRQQQIIAAYWLSGAVLLAGVGQMVMLFPSLRAAGFHFQPMLRCWTPAVKQLILLTLPLAGGAGVLQVGTMLDKAIAQAFAQAPGHYSFSVVGHTLPYPIVEGATARLNEAQAMYQFPLAVFGIALATAIYPMLSREALDPFGDGFKRVLRQGIDGSLFIGLPASAGMVLVAHPAIHLLFQGGLCSYADAEWMALSTAIYSSAIWAFSLLQIVNRGFYSLHDARAPLRWMIYNLIINVVVEVPLLWTRLGEGAMAVGTLVSFSIQAVAMLWLLERRLGGMQLGKVLPSVAKMIFATLVMLGVCLAFQQTPLYPHGAVNIVNTFGEMTKATRAQLTFDARIVWAIQLAEMMLLGAVTYFLTCAALGMDVLKHVPMRKRKAVTRV